MVSVRRILLTLPMTLRDAAGLCQHGIGNIRCDRPECKPIFREDGCFVGGAHGLEESVPMALRQRLCHALQRSQPILSPLAR
jgi:hypothetical protein